MKTFLIVFLAMVTAVACSMGGRSARLRSKVDQRKIFWYNCNKEMTPDFKGKFCLVTCEIKLLKNGSCKKNKYKYIVKDHKENHEFFNGFVMVPANYLF